MKAGAHSEVVLHVTSNFYWFGTYEKVTCVILKDYIVWKILSPVRKPWHISGRAIILFIVSIKQWKSLLICLLQNLDKQKNGRNTERLHHTFIEESNSILEWYTYIRMQDTYTHPAPCTMSHTNVDIWWDATPTCQSRYLQFTKSNLTISLTSRVSVHPWACSWKYWILAQWISFWRS